MAYQETTFTNLGTAQAPDASLSENFAGSNFDPFAISDQTNQLLTDVTKTAIKRREDEVKQYNLGLQNLFKTVGDDLSAELDPKDYKVLSDEGNKIIDDYYKNPETLLGKNPEKARELNTRLMNLASRSNLSKNTKKVSDFNNQLIKKDADWDNEVNRYYQDKYNKSSLEERATNSVTPIKDSRGDFLRVELPKFQSTTGTETTQTIVDPSDAGSKIIVTTKTYDPEVHRQWYKADNGLFLSELWKIKPEVQSNPETDTPEKFINSEADRVFEKTKVTSKVRVDKNQAYIQDKITERNDADNTQSNTNNVRNNENKIELQKRKEVAKEAAGINNFPLVDNANRRIETLITETEPYSISDATKKELLKTLPASASKAEIASAIKNASEMKFEKLNGGNASDEMNKKLFGNENNPEYGTYFKVTEKGKDPYYVTGKSVYFDKKGKEITKDEFKTAFQPTTQVVPNLSKTYTKEKLFESELSSRDGAKKEYEKYLKAGKGVEDIDAEINKANQPSGAIDKTKLLEQAEKLKDVDYGMGAKGAGGKMDCSGFVCAVLNGSGVKVSGTSEEIFANAPIKITNPKELIAGDVVAVDTGKTSFDKGRANGIDHVGVVIEKDGKLFFAESQGSKGFNMTPLEDKLTKYQNSKYKIFAGRYEIGSTKTAPKATTTAPKVIKSKKGFTYTVE